MSLEHEMERVGRITAADQGLEVRVRGVRAYAVPGTVTIPNISTFEWLGKSAYRMLHGLLDHECGHAVDSDFEATKQFRLTHPPAALDVLANMIEDGYVERLRGRRYRGCQHNIMLMNEWFYQHKGIDGKDPIDRISDGADQWESFVSALGMVLTPYGHRDIEFFEPINPEVYRMLCECRSDIEELQAIIVTKATAKNIEIARRIFERYNKSKPSQSEPENGTGDKSDEQDKSDEESDEQPEENGEESEGEADDEADDGPGDDDDVGENDTDDGDDSDKSEGEGEESEGEGEESEGEGEESGDDGDIEVFTADDDDESDSDGGSADDGEESESTTADDSDSSDDSGTDSEETTKPKGKDGDKPMKSGTAIMDLDRWSSSEIPLHASDQINVIIGNVFEQVGSTQPYTIFSEEFDAFRDFASEDQTAVSAAYEREMEEVYKVADSLIQCFESALMASEMARPVGGNDEGHIDSDAIGEYAVGSLPADQLYIQYAETDLHDVAVSILCDCSGSMSSEKSVLCRRTAMAISHALQQVHIAHEVGGFTTFHSNQVQHHEWAEGRRNEYEDNFQRMREALAEAQQQGTDVTKFARAVRRGAFSANSILTVPFHVIFKNFESEDARSLARITAIAENLDGEAVYWIARRLAERPEKRKVLFVLSDGLPAGSRDNLQGARYLKEVIERVADSGIEIYGIGIKSEHVRAYYPQWWLCDKIEDLISIAIEGLTEVLTRNRQERTRIDL